MHEAHLARQFLDAALAHTSLAPGEQMLIVRGWVAETESLSPESLAFHFRALTNGTPHSLARLEVRVSHVRAKCLECQGEYLPEHHLLLCPSCGGTGAELLGQVGFGIDEIEVGPK
jgi:hydrogenase nickel incorporation protein HypA/HybF